MNGDSLAGGEYWRPLTAVFLHNNIIHLLFNMLALFAFSLCARLFHKSKYAWLGIFIVGAVVGNYVEGYIAPQTNVVGASGGVMAMWGGFIAVVWRAYFFKGKELEWVRNTLKLKSTLIPLFVQMVALDPFLFAWQVHVIGFLTGFVLGCLLSLRGQLYVCASRQGIAAVGDEVEVEMFRWHKWRRFRAVRLPVTVADDMNRSEDAVVLVRSAVNWRNRVEFEVVRVLAGTSCQWQSSPKLRPKVALSDFVVLARVHCPAEHQVTKGKQHGSA